MLDPLTLDDLDHLHHTLFRRDNPVHLPRQLNVRHIRRHFTRVHTKQDCIVVLPLQLGSHVPHRHIQGRFGSGIGREAVLHLSEQAG